MAETGGMRMRRGEEAALQGTITKNKNSPSRAGAGDALGQIGTSTQLAQTG